MYIAKQEEIRMIELVNQKRTSLGLSPLSFCPKLRHIARQHSLEQLNQNDIYHVSKVTGTPKDRADAANYPYRVMAENVAMGADVKVLHQKLLQSPGHYKNIIHPTVDHIAIGIMKNLKGTHFITQLFSKKLKRYSTTDVFGYLKRAYPNIEITPMLNLFSKQLTEGQIELQKAVQYIPGKYRHKRLRIYTQSLQDIEQVNIPSHTKVLLGMHQSHQTYYITTIIF